MKFYQADAFTDTVFKGNPAAVVPLENWLSPIAMQQIAAENNLSETAFFKKNVDGSFEIRWFTPETEVDLCGHATLAAAHVLFNHLGYSGPEIAFQSKSGILTVERRGDFYWMNFPSRPPEPVPVPKLLPEAIGTIPVYTGIHTDLLVLVNEENTLLAIKPDITLLLGLGVRGVIVTALSSESGIDFVSRFFAPSVGIPEDPVTGSAHTLLIPFWAKRLDKKYLTARQLSKRGGYIECIHKGERVEIGGQAVTYLTGEIFI